ncbi:IS3 family transposase [Gemella sanguinis]|uniref:IS3 family transposase n=1 Tax=Gemella sanguinis TaxID=84135 RepID=UPI0009E47119
MVVKNCSSFKTFNNYIDCYNNKRIQAIVKWISPAQYRITSRFLNAYHYKKTFLFYF